MILNPRLTIRECVLFLASRIMAKYFHLDGWSWSRQFNAESCAFCPCLEVARPIMAMFYNKMKMQECNK